MNQVLIPLIYFWVTSHKQQLKRTYKTFVRASLEEASLPRLMLLHVKCNHSVQLLYTAPCSNSIAIPVVRLEESQELFRLGMQYTYTLSL